MACEKGRTINADIKDVRPSIRDFCFANLVRSANDTLNKQPHPFLDETASTIRENTIDEQVSAPVVCFKNIIVVQNSQRFRYPATE